MRKVLLILIAVSLLVRFSAFAETLEIKELRLKSMESDALVIQTAIQRDQAQIMFLQERIARLKQENQTRLDAVKQMRSEIKKIKDETPKAKKEEKK